MPAEPAKVRSERPTSADGFGLHADISGDGAQVLLGLHGGPGGDGSSYLRPLHLLGGDATTVVTFDQLGTGRSELPPDAYPWSVAAASADVEAVRLHLGADQVDLLGHSWGGMLALQYTLDHPQRVRRLVLSNTISSTARMTAAFLRQVLDVLPSRQAAAALTADAVGDHADPTFRAATAAWLQAWSTGLATSPDTTTNMVVEALEPGPAGHGLWGDRLWFATGALRGWDVEDRLGEITAPTLAIHGGHDLSTPEANEVLAAGIPDCEWITLARNGHGMFDEPNADVYLSIVRSFLDGWSRTKEGTAP